MKWIIFVWLAGTNPYGLFLAAKPTLLKKGMLMVITTIIYGIIGATTVVALYKFFF